MQPFNCPDCNTPLEIVKGVSDLMNGEIYCPKCKDVFEMKKRKKVFKSEILKEKDFVPDNFKEERDKIRMDNPLFKFNRLEEPSFECDHEEWEWFKCGYDNEVQLCERCGLNWFYHKPKKNCIKCGKLFRLDKEQVDLDDHFCSYKCEKTFKEREAELPEKVHCPKCIGNGWTSDVWDSPNIRVRCRWCEGYGKVDRTPFFECRHEWIQMYENVETCTRCLGVHCFKCDHIGLMNKEGICEKCCIYFDPKDDPKEKKVEAKEVAHKT